MPKRAIEINKLIKDKKAGKYRTLIIQLGSGDGKGEGADRVIKKYTIKVKK